MQAKTLTLKLVFSLCCAAIFVFGLQAQQIPDASVAGRPVQFHVFGSQGFMYSNQNNYMTMDTSKGSFAFTDFGANVSTRLTDKFRVGAQIYDRNIGKLGNWQPTLDWAVADYKFADWFGVRAGKVKTTLGLFTDSQDGGVPAYLGPNATVGLFLGPARFHDQSLWRRHLRGKHQFEEDRRTELHRLRRPKAPGYDRWIRVCAGDVGETGQ